MSQDGYHNRREEPEIRLPNRGWKVSAISATLALVVFLGGGVVFVANDRSKALANIDSLTNAMAGEIAAGKVQDERIAALERQQTEIATDVKWIRAGLDRSGVKP